MGSLLKIDRTAAAIIIAGFAMGGFIYFAEKTFQKRAGDLFENGPAIQGSSLDEPGFQGSATGSVEERKSDDTAAVQGYDCVSYEKAGDFVGDTKCIFGRVDRVFISSGGTIFLDFCPDYKTCPFSAVIFKSDSAKFPDVEKYEGKNVEISGLVKTYQGRPEIILNDANQIEVK
jgi:hypothetical protein